MKGYGVGDNSEDEDEKPAKKDDKNKANVKTSDINVELKEEPAKPADIVDMFE